MGESVHHNTAACRIVYPIHLLHNFHRQVDSSLNLTDGLRSADISNYSLPRLNTRVGERDFSYAGPAAWNRLPESIRQLQTTSFKHKLKTFLFTKCYNSADWLYLLVILDLLTI